MTNEELADIIRNDILPKCADRCLTTGAEQYTQGDGSQKFEKMSQEELIQECEDELLDSLNYIIMRIIRLRQNFG